MMLGVTVGENPFSHDSSPTPLCLDSADISSNVSSLSQTHPHSQRNVKLELEKVLLLAPLAPLRFLFLDFNNQIIGNGLKAVVTL